jgi:hypothetical protein
MTHTTFCMYLAVIRGTMLTLYDYVQWLKQTVDSPQAMVEDEISRYMQGAKEAYSILINSRGLTSVASGQCIVWHEAPGSGA